MSNKPPDTESIEYMTFSGDEVNHVLDQLQPALKGFPIHLSITACLTIVIMMQFPDINRAQMDKTILDISDYIANYLDMLDPESKVTMPKNKVN